MSNIRSALSKLRLSLVSDSLRNLALLKQWQWLDAQQMEDLQKKSLSELFYHAYEHVPYYKDIICDIGIINNAGEIDLDRFSQIPLLDKSTLNSCFEDLKSDDIDKRKWHKNKSGGSSGEPIALLQDADYRSWSIATSMLMDSWSNYSISERKVVLWGSLRDLFARSEPFKVRMVRWLKNELWLNAFRMKTDHMETYVKKIDEFKPVMILAYAESLYELSSFLEEKGLRIHSPRTIMTSAGTLFPHMREKIETVFGSPVFNRYGSREVGAIACECDRHSGLHVASPVNLIEILLPDGSPAGPGQIGEIVVTSLTNFTMPLIRYRIGDVGSWKRDACPCGRSWPLLDKVSGRVTDIFITRDKGVVSPEYFIHLIGVELNTGWISKFQVIQENYEHLHVKIVKKTRTNDAIDIHTPEIENIKAKIQLVMGQNCLVDFQFVEDIPPSPSGKFLYTLTKIKR